MLSRPVTGLRASLRNREFLAAAAGAALLAGLGGPAEAYPFDLQPRAAAQPEAIRPALTRPARAVVPREKVAPKEKEAADELAAKTKGVLTVVVSLDKQHLTLYSDGHPVAHTKVSTGTASHPTPTGVFSVIQKDRWHRSNIYGNAPMFFMQRITWSGVAMHQGFVTGQPASHGCIRLPEAFAKQLWPVTQLGARVIVARSEVTPMAFAHDRLFTIKPRPEPAPPAAPEVAATTDTSGQGAPEVAQLDGSKSTASDAAAPNPVLSILAYGDDVPVWKPRRAKSAASTTAVTEPRPLKPGPISVFISRKEGKLFVRKGFEPVFNVPVTFEQPDKPLGTHVFSALAVNDDSTTLRWNVMTVPGGTSITKPATKKPEKGAKVVAPVAEPASTPAEALNRVTIPPEALQEISALMSAGASLIISDQGLSGETGKGTDFIVLVR